MLRENQSELDAEINSLPTQQLRIEECRNCCNCISRLHWAYSRLTFQVDEIGRAAAYKMYFGSSRNLEATSQCTAKFAWPATLLLAASI